MKNLIAILLLLSSWSVSTAAQEWFGGADLGIQVTSRRGRAIAGARVTIIYKSAEQDVGPGPVATDSKGKAVFSGIQAGLWQVEVAHDDYLSYVASVEIQYDKKPIVQASFLQAGGRSLVPMKAKFFKVTSEASSPTIGPPLEAAPPVAAKPAAKTPVDEPKRPAEELSPPPSSTAPGPAGQLPDPAPVAKPNDPVPEPEIEATAETASKPQAAVTPPTHPTHPVSAPKPPPPVRPAPTEEQRPAAAKPQAIPKEIPLERPEVSLPVTPPVHAPEIPADRLPASESSPPSPPIPEQTLPEPAEAEEQPLTSVPVVVDSAPEEVEAVVAPQVPSTPAPPLVSAEFEARSRVLPEPPAAGLTLRSSRSQTCPECRPREWSVTSEQITGIGQPDASCPDDLKASARKALSFLASSISLELISFAGTVGDGSTNDAAHLIDSESQVTFRALQGEYWNPLASCRIVAVVLPKASRFVGFRYDAVDVNSSGACLPSNDCDIGESHWTDHPEILRGPSATVVYGFFVNQSSEYRRRARLTAYFAPNSSEWTPAATP